MDWQGIGTFIAALSGAILGFAALYRTHRQNRAKADKSAVAGYISLVDDMRIAIGEYQKRVSAVEGELLACEKGKAELQVQINDLFLKLGEHRGRQEGGREQPA